jgi:hypothetical protein
MEISRRYRDLKPRSFARFTGFANGEAGDTQDLPGEKEPETGMFEVLPFEDRLFEFFGNPIPIIFTHERETVPLK